jgi:hypothetical protein
VQAFASKGNPFPVNDGELIKDSAPILYGNARVPSTRIDLKNYIKKGKALDIMVKYT